MRRNAEIGHRSGTGDEERLQLVVGELRQRTTVSVGEHDPAQRSALHMQRDASLTQRLDVAVHRSHRNPKLLRQVARRQTPLTLKELQTRNQAVRLHRWLFPPVYDRACHIQAVRYSHPNRRQGDLAMTTSTEPQTVTGLITGVDIFAFYTGDPQRSIAFYRDVLGMTPTEIDDQGRGAEFTLSDGSTFGVWRPDDGATSGAAA